MFQNPPQTQTLYTQAGETKQNKKFATKKYIKSDHTNSSFGFCRHSKC